MCGEVRSPASCFVCFVSLGLRRRIEPLLEPSLSLFGAPLLTSVLLPFPRETRGAFARRRRRSSLLRERRNEFAEISSLSFASLSICTVPIKGAAGPRRWPHVSFKLVKTAAMETRWNEAAPLFFEARQRFGHHRPAAAVWPPLACALASAASGRRGRATEREKAQIGVQTKRPTCRQAARRKSRRAQKTRESTEPEPERQRRLAGIIKIPRCPLTCCSWDSPPPLRAGIQSLTNGQNASKAEDDKKAYKLNNN